MDIWHGKNLPEGVSRSFIKRPIIRVNIADILVQAHNNGFIDMKIPEVRRFALKTLEKATNDRTRDVKLIGSSLFLLANIDNPDDVDKLMDYIDSRSEYVFRSSVIGLPMMCNDRARLALRSLEKELKDEGRKEFVQGVQSKDRTLWCEARENR